MGMKALNQLDTKLCKELDELAEKKDLSAGDLEMTYKITSTIKNIRKIELMEEEGYSHAGNWRAEGDYGRSYGNGRAGTHYVGGYYSHDGGGSYNDGMSGGRYRRSGRYSMEDGREMFGNSMRNMMSDEAYDPMEREAMQRAYRNY